MHPRAIETRYKGYRFRSRLEARWAVFFDALGLRWEYEPEGFELPSGRYLPDFKVEGRWVEVKPTPDVDAAARGKFAELVAASGLPGVILCGPPALDPEDQHHQLFGACAELLDFAGVDWRTWHNAAYDALGTRFGQGGRA